MITDPNNVAAGEQQPALEEFRPPEIVLKVSSDKMELELLLQKKYDHTLPPVYEDIMAKVAEKRVVFGILETTIRSLCENPVFNHSYVIARGVPAETGADGEHTYKVNTVKELKPKLREDGTADYRDLGFIQNVRKGQVLCEFKLPEKGADGHDVYGKVLEGRFGRDPFNPQGKNTEYNEDKTQLLSMVDGNVEVVRGTVNVIDVLRISGNVDNATGDIDFVGDVVVNGDVVSGFKVLSQGSVTIKGSVEGAIIQARKDIAVGEGINGMNRGSVIAGGNLKCKYIQGCYIQADENIYADSIMYCTMECSGNVELGGKRAVLIGGKSSIAGSLSAKTIGTDSHVNTQITMASSGTKKHHEILELNSELKNIDAENMKLLQVMTRYEDLIKQGRVNAEQAKAVDTVKNQYRAQAERRNEVLRRMDEIKQEQLEASANSFIVCKGRVHVGVQITFGPLTMSVQNSFVNSRITIVDGDIAVLAQ